MLQNNENAKTDYVRARMSPDVKEAAEAVFSKLGLGHTEAIRLFYQQVILNQGLPFGVKIPNAETVRAMQQVKSRKNLTRYNNT
ncbi:MAG: type II toxin-antitoxin system RelB/DinJ family antitoxin, partial [Rickettsiales bacterium]